MNQTLKTSENFYLDLPYIENFYDSYKKENYYFPPKNWYLFMTDIKNSTLAIEKGKYKEVNIASVLVVVAISNLLKTLEFPFAFGGDGITFLIPGPYLEKIKESLSSLKNMIYKNFNLEMRVGYISVKELNEKNLTLKIAKLKISECYYQALFIGDGFSYFEKLLKSNQINFNLPTTEKTVDLTGFSCRWQDIESTKDFQMAIIIKILEEKDEESLLESILTQIYKIYGDFSNWHPLAIHKMQTIPLNSEFINLEAKITNPKENFINTLKIKFQLLFTKMAIRLPFEIGIKINEHDITKIKTMNYVSSDFKKIEGGIKLILNSTKEEQEKLLEYLENLYNQKKIVYGYYSDKKAHITCGVFMDRKQDVHFIDVINGGYTNAAKMLKEKLANIKK